MSSDPGVPAEAPMPEGVYSIGLDALVRRYGYTPDSIEQVMIVVDAALPVIAAAERDRWRAALKDALEGMEDMLPYVPEFFREKWDHQAYLDRARVALEQEVPR